MKLLKQEIFDETEVFFKFIDGGNLLSIPHTHEFYELFIVINGAVTHCVCNSQQLLEEGEMILIRPRDCHSLMGAKDSEILNMAFSTAVFDAILCLFQQNEKLLELCGQEIPVIHKLGKEQLHNIKRQFKEAQSLYGGKTASAIQYKSLLVSLLGQLAASFQPPSNLVPIWLTQLIQKMGTVDIFTREIKEIYALSDRTPEHIARTFRKYMCITPTDYIVQLRINYARELLLTTDKSALEVCFDAGFNSPGYFYRCFKQAFGMTPGKFQKMYCFKI